MRLLGPRSLSSLLKIALDVVYFGIWGLIGVLFLAAITVLSVPNLASQALMELNLTPAIKRATGAAPQAMLLAAFAISLAGYLWIMGLTRHIFKTLSQGNVFIEANTYRLRQIGIGLMAIEVFGYVTRILTKTMFAINFEPVYGLRVVTTWFAIMVVFVLAEVFSEGARIKNQADFTV